MGIYGLGVIMGPAIGPTLGGWLTPNYSWPWIFYVNVPIGFTRLLLISRFIHDPLYLERKTGRADLRGTTTYQAEMITSLINPYRNITTESIESLASAMIASGSDPWTARLQAVDFLNYELSRQAMMISFNRVFFLVAVLFAVVVPMVLLLKETESPAENEKVSA